MIAVFGTCFPVISHNFVKLCCFLSQTALDPERIPDEDDADIAFNEMGENCTIYKQRNYNEHSVMTARPIYFISKIFLTIV